MRIRFLASTFAFSTLAVAVAACSSSPSSNTTSSGDACRHYFEASKAFADHCQTNLNQTESEDRFVLQCQTLFAAPGAPAATAALDQCATAESAQVASCDTSTPTACDVAPKGTLASGAACGVDFQCQSGHCKGAGVSTNESNGGVTTTTSCGVCADRVAVGQTCDPRVDACVDGAYCYATGTTAGNGTCVTRVQNDVGGSCAPPAQCKSGLVCDGTTMKCKARGDAGADCTAQYECKSPLACVSNKCATGKAAGEACTGSDCGGNTYCDFTSMTCKGTSSADPGQPCGGADFIVCKVGICPSSTGGATAKCPSVLADGQPCAQPMTDTTCDEGAYCINGKCAVYDPSVCK